MERLGKAVARLTEPENRLREQNQNKLLTPRYNSTFWTYRRSNEEFSYDAQIHSVIQKMVSFQNFPLPIPSGKPILHPHAWNGRSLTFNSTTENSWDPHLYTDGEEVMTTR